jgi:hypothetical protein
MKTFIEKIFNRNTFAYFQIHVAHPAKRDEAFGCLRSRLIPSEQKSKGEEKALARRSLLAEAANRNTRPLENP